MVTVPVIKYIDERMEEEDKTHIVMAIFNKFYRKWNMTRDEPIWNASDKKSNYRLLSIRRVEFKSIFSQYDYVKVSDEEEPSDTVFRLVSLHEITSVVS